MIPKTLADALGVFGSRETDGAGTGVVSEGVAAVTVAAEAAPNDEAAGSETEAKNSEASELAEVTAPEVRLISDPAPIVLRPTDKLITPAVPEDETPVLSEI